MILNSVKIFTNSFAPVGLTELLPGLHPRNILVWLFLHAAEMSRRRHWKPSHKNGRNQFGVLESSPRVGTQEKELPTGEGKNFGAASKSVTLKMGGYPGVTPYQIV
jgi:hypothetical protein